MNKYISHSEGDERLGWLHFLPIVNKAATDLNGHVFPRVGSRGLWEYFQIWYSGVIWQYIFSFW